MRDIIQDLKNYLHGYNMRPSIKSDTFIGMFSGVNLTNMSPIAKNLIALGQTSYQNRSDLDNPVSFDTQEELTEYCISNGIDEKHNAMLMYLKLKTPYKIENTEFMFLCNTNRTKVLVQDITAVQPLTPYQLSNGSWLTLDRDRSFLGMYPSLIEAQNALEDLGY